MQHPQNKPTFIEKGVTLEGSVSFEGRLTIHGTVKGSLVGDHIVIAEEGVVMAETQASFMSIAGVFKGRLRVSGKMVLLPTGNCSGNIACREMELVAGGVLNGKIRCGQ